MRGGRADLRGWEGLCQWYERGCEGWVKYLSTEGYGRRGRLHSVFKLNFAIWDNVQRQMLCK